MQYEPRSESPTPAYPIPQQYPPQSVPPGYPQMYGPPPQPPKSKMSAKDWKLFSIIFVPIAAVLMVLLVVGLLQGPSKSARFDVQIVSCKFEGADFLPSATVGLTIKNTGDAADDARISIEYRDSSGARIDTDTAYVRDIPPGDTVRTEEVTMLDAPVTSGRCVVTGIS